MRAVSEAERWQQRRLAEIDADMRRRHQEEAALREGDQSVGPKQPQAAAAAAAAGRRDAGAAQRGAARRWDAWVRATRWTQSAAADAVGAGVVSACICAGTRHSAVRTVDVNGTLKEETGWDE